MLHDVASLADTIQQDQFASAAHEAMLNVMITSARISSALADAMAEHDLTPAQYNVLQILREMSPQRVPCSHIASRLIDRTPDVTRLLDRLQRAGLVERERAEHDRRVVEVNITRAGLERIEQLERPIEALTAQLFSGLDEAQQRRLSELLEQMRTGAAHRPANGTQA